MNGNQCICMSLTATSMVICMRVPPIHSQAVTSISCHLYESSTYSLINSRIAALVCDPYLLLTVTHCICMRALLNYSLTVTQILINNLTNSNHFICMRAARIYPLTFASMSLTYNHMNGNHCICM